VVSRVQPLDQLAEATVEGPRFRAETLVKGRLTQKEFLRHIQEVAIAQAEEGDELIMTVHVLDPEPMQLRKTTLATTMAERLTTPRASTRNKPYLRPSSDIGGYFQRRRLGNYHLIDLGTTRSNSYPRHPT